MALPAAARQDLAARRSDVGRKADQPEVNQVLRPVQVGDALDRPAESAVAVVGPRLVHEIVAPAAARHRVGPELSDDHIVVFIALDQIGARGGQDEVIATTAEHRVVASTGLNPVVALVGEDEIRAGARANGVAAEAADDGVGAVPGADAVIAAVAEDEVRSGAAHQQVVAVRRSLPPRMVAEPAPIVSRPPPPPDRNRKNAVGVQNDRIGTFVAEIADTVVRGVRTDQQVVAKSAEDRVIAGCHPSRIGAFVAEHEIISGVLARYPDEIVAEAADQGIAAASAVDGIIAAMPEHEVGSPAGGHEIGTITRVVAAQDGLPYGCEDAH